jgi:hypothetical protein
MVNKNKDKKTTLWHKTDIIHQADGSFRLRCASCKKFFAMKNPANFWQTHKKSCPTAQRGSEQTRGEFKILQAWLNFASLVCSSQSSSLFQWGLVIAL